MDLIENRTVDEIAVGDRAEIERVLTQPDISLFATVSADINPATVVEDDEEGPELTQGIAHGMWAGTLISAVLATRLPGPGTVHLGQTLTFHRPVNVGDRILVRVEVTGIDKATGKVTLDCACLDGQGETIVSGQAEVRAPRTQDPATHRPHAGVPDLKAPWRALRRTCRARKGARSAADRDRPSLR
jgi:phosphate acetyltransferase